MTVDLTAARIRRAARRRHGPAIDERIAKEDAAIVHDIIACVRRAYAIEPSCPYWCTGEEATVETILRTVGGVSPKDEDAAISEGIWMAHQLTHAEKLTGESDIYRGWLLVVGHVENYDYSWVFEDEEGSSDEGPGDGVVVPLPGVTLDEAAVVEDEDNEDGRTPRRRGRPRPQLVTEPEALSNEDMNRLFHQLMGEQT